MRVAPCSWALLLVPAAYWVGCSGSTLGGACSNDGMCAAGRLCLEGSCRALCFDSYDCAAGERCERGGCVLCAGNECRGSEAGDAAPGDSAGAGDQGPGGGDPTSIVGDGTASGDAATNGGGDSPAGDARSSAGDTSAPGDAACDADGACGDEPAAGDNAGCLAVVETSCDDGADEDCDEATDCDDSDCAAAAVAWMDTSLCGGCKAPCDGSCTGLKTQVNGCGQPRTTACSIDGPDCPCVPDCPSRPCGNCGLGWDDGCNNRCDFCAQCFNAADVCASQSMDNPCD